MVLKKSPGGSIFPYYYKNGELFGVHYGSFFDDEAALLARMQGEEAFIQEQRGQFPMWVDFYQSRLTDPVLLELAAQMDRLQHRITRLAVAGCSSRDQSRLRRLARSSGHEFVMPLRFFKDPEAAKSWLVGE